MDIATTYKFFMECDRIACGYKSQYFLYAKEARQLFIKNLI